MSYQAILEYLTKVSQIYFQSDKKKKTQLLNHASLITGFHRKSLIRRIALNSSPSLKKRPGAKPRYPEDLLLPHIEFLWNSMERISARRMKAALSHWLPYYKAPDPRCRKLLMEMSISTLDRFLNKIRAKKTSLKGRSSTSPARHMKNKVPINTLDSNITRPGYAQTDTVAHCGDGLAGEFMNSITLTDVYSAWTENRALLTKKAPRVRQYFMDIFASIPFSLIAINTDSGSEFLNKPVYHLLKKNRIIFTRSRPYKKNDNCYVEQKNYTHVRELFGYQRIEDKDLEEMMNDIYKNYWNPLQNFFLPTFKLKEKVRVGARIKKTYHSPITPYQRLMQSPELSEEQKEALLRKRESLNPFELKKGLEEKLFYFFNQLNQYNKQRRAA